MLIVWRLEWTRVRSWSTPSGTIEQRSAWLGTMFFTDGSCAADIYIRITTVTAAMARLNRICDCRDISFTTKHMLYKSSHCHHPPVQM